MKPIPGFPHYFADEKGNIYSEKISNSIKLYNPPKILKANKGRYGYLAVGLRREGATYRKSIHRLILKTFIGECPPNCEGCHNNGDHTNNGIDNLRWDTKSGNASDRIKHNTVTKGEKNGNHKLNELQVRITIRLLQMTYRKYGTGQYLSQIWGVSRFAINKIARNKSWRHVL